MFLRRVVCVRLTEKRGSSELRKSSAFMQLGLTLTTLTYDSRVDFRSTGNALQTDKKRHATSASVCAVAYVGN